MPKPQTPNPTIRKPPVAAVESFVNGSDEVSRLEVLPELGATHPKPPTETKRKRLTVDVPIDHWWSLKTRAMHEGRSLQQLLADAVAALVR